MIMTMFYRLNEQQYARMILNEEMHYPKFLDKLKGDVGTAVFSKLLQLIKNNVWEYDFPIIVDSDYVDVICIHIELVKSDDITEQFGQYATYFNNKEYLVNGKLDKPTISISAPCNGKDVDYFALERNLYHEITHLYDDWVSIKNGNGCLCKRIGNIYTESFVEDSMGGAVGGDLFKSISFLAYMSIKTERQAFASQTVKELEGLGLDLYNYKEIIQKTSFFKNISLSYNEAIDGLEKCSDSDLELLNKQLIARYPNANIPKNKGDNFDIGKYRQKLIKWVDKSYRNGMKVYGGVVQYYLNQLEKEHFKKYGIPLDLWEYRRQW